ncbi:MAG: hypothetical protein EKK40_01465 [Bradyrhizobiaceae bacterium]|nr:MAG: hypothetical protein EKK40_01465 [Bradyrhizobiaceae bacterium]
MSLLIGLCGASAIAHAQPYYGYGPGYGRPNYGGPAYGGGPGYGGGGTLCAYENQFCAFRGPATVRYGARGRYVVRRAVNGIPCSNHVFGDPIRGVQKRCFVMY